ncbi:MAG TPA: hypothetical protein VES67_15980 [Vicinamibacterales bacterium]|nr:hypothetical protein [Vicinamibacterales bacterium]
MIGTTRARVLIAAFAAWLALGASGATGEPPAARAFLTSTFNLTKGEFDRLDAGQVITRTLGASDKREVATLGIVRVKMTPEFYVERLDDIVSFKKHGGDEAVLQIGAFSSPPAVKDMAAMTLDDTDVRSLRRCRVGSCGLQLSAAAITKFQQEIDWRRPDAHQLAEQLLRRTLVEYVAAYMKAGTAASMEYADEAERMNIGREFVSLMGPDVAGWKSFPALRQHLLDYPASDAPGTIDRLYWSKEKVRRTVVSVTHLAIMRTANDTPADYAIASRQIYGTHYFDASLGLTVLVRDRLAASPVTYLVYLNRSRVDVFGGIFGGMTRHIVTGKARGTVSDLLARLQRTLERQFGQSKTATPR